MSFVGGVVLVKSVEVTDNVDSLFDVCAADMLCCFCSAHVKCHYR